MIFNLAIASIAIFFVLFFVKQYFKISLASYIILLQYVWMFLSIIVIENGIFINEQGRNGYFVFSSILLLFFLISTLGGLLFFNWFFSKLLKNESPLRFSIFGWGEIKLVTIIVCVILSLAYINLGMSPVPLFSYEVTKFNFWEYAKFPFLKAIIGNVMGFVAFATSILYNYKKRFSILLLGLYFLYLLLLGQKFTGFLLGSYGVLLGYVVANDVKVNFKVSWVFHRYVILFVSLLFLVVLSFYSNHNPYEYMGLSPFEAVFYRAFGLQAHVFWGVVERYVYTGVTNTWKISELWNGMHLLMHEFWPWSEESFLSVTNRGVSWTNAYPSILVRIFPWPIAIIANFFLMSLVALVQSLLFFFLKNKSYIVSIVVFQLLTWVSYAYTMAYFKKTFIPIVVSIVLIVVLTLIKKGKNEPGKA